MTLPPGASQILEGGTLGLVAFLLLAITALGYGAIRTVRAFMAREIITRETYDEMRTRDQAELDRVGAERDRAMALAEAQTEATERLAQTLELGLERVAEGLAARNALEAEYHSGPPPRRRVARSSRATK